MTQQGVHELRVHRKARRELLAIETDELREKRLVAEDPNTTGEVLNSLIDRFNRFNRHVYEAHFDFDKGDLAKMALFEAVAAHPNTPSDLLLFLVRCSFSYDAFSHFNYPCIRLLAPWHAIPPLPLLGMGIVTSLGMVVMVRRHKTKHAT